METPVLGNRSSLGYWAPILIAHLPHLKNNNYPNHQAEQILYEVTSNSYLALLDVFERLRREKVNFKLNMVLSPTLLDMWSDAQLQEGFGLYLHQRVQFSRQQLQDTQSDPQLHDLAQMYYFKANYALKQYDDLYSRDLIKAFASFVDSGHINLLATCATYAYLPMLEPKEFLCKAQISLGRDLTAQYTGHFPTGFWLPECGYRSHLDKILLDCGVGYTVATPASLVCAAPAPTCATYLPVLGDSGLPIFGLDIEAQLEVWSASHGYYTSPCYRDFASNICGHPALKQSCDAESIKDADLRLQAFKYFSKTGPTDRKNYYNTIAANRTAWRHSSQFVYDRRRQARWLYNVFTKHGMDAQKLPPVCVSAFNAEFFGYYWYEGPLWLEYILRQMSSDPRLIQTARLDDLLQHYLSAGPEAIQTVTPNPGSWLDGSYAERFINPTSDWVYKHLAIAGQRLYKMTRLGHQQDQQKKRMINLATRALLMAQSADWPVMLSAGEHPNLVTKRLRHHLNAFHKLFDDYREGRVDAIALRTLENDSSFLKDLDYSTYFTHSTAASAPSTGPEYQNRTERSLYNVNSSEPISKETVISSIIRLQTVTRELMGLCQDALAHGGGVIYSDISHKASESVEIVEQLAHIADNQELGQKYADSTSQLSQLISDINAATSPHELQELNALSTEIINAWAIAVEKLLQSAIAKAKI